MSVMERKGEPRKIRAQVAHFNRYDCKKEQSPYEKKNYLGKGNNGQVYTACKRKTKEEDCNFAIKETLFSPENFDSPKIEASLLLMLQNENWIDSRGNKQPLVPRLLDAWICDGEPWYGTVQIVMEKWDGDMLNRGKQRAFDLKIEGAKSAESTEDDQTPPVLAYTQQEIDDMHLLAYHLDDINIRHGDLSPGQILFKRDLGKNIKNMSVTDFALFDSYGYMENTFQCPGYLDERVLPDLYPFFNRGQLSSFLASDSITYVVADNGELKKFVPFADVPSRWYEIIRLICPKYPNPERDQLYSSAKISKMKRYHARQESEKIGTDKEEEYDRWILQYLQS